MHHLGVAPGRGFAGDRVAFNRYAYAEGAPTMFRDPSGLISISEMGVLNIAKVQSNGRLLRESLLMGPRGALKVESIWENGKLITVVLIG